MEGAVAVREMLITQCICGQRAAEVIGRKDDRSVGKCENCGIIRTLEREPEYIQLYTEGDRYHAEREGHIPYRERYDHDYGIAATRLPKLINQFTLLDVGCANGAFVKYASQMGFQASGLELNPHMAAWARERTRRPIYETWEELGTSRFNIITYHDVFEHVVDPSAELLRVRDRLTEDGLLILDVPDADDPRFATLGMQWHHMKPKEHLWFWTKSTLERLMLAYGFTAKFDTPIQGKLVVYARKW